MHLRTLPNVLGIHPILSLWTRTGASAFAALRWAFSEFVCSSTAWDRIGVRLLCRAFSTPKTGRQYSYRPSVIDTVTILQRTDSANHASVTALCRDTAIVSPTPTMSRAVKISIAVSANRERQPANVNPRATSLSAIARWNFCIFELYAPPTVLQSASRHIVIAIRLLAPPRTMPWDQQRTFLYIYHYHLTNSFVIYFLKSRVCVSYFTDLGLWRAKIPELISTADIAEFDCYNFFVTYLSSFYGFNYWLVSQAFFFGSLCELFFSSLCLPKNMIMVSLIDRAFLLLYPLFLEKKVYIWSSFSYCYRMRIFWKWFLTFCDDYSYHLLRVLLLQKTKSIE